MALSLTTSAQIYTQSKYVAADQSGAKGGATNAKNRANSSNNNDGYIAQSFNP